MSNLKLISRDSLLYYHQKLKTALAEKVDKATGYSLMPDAEIARLALVVNYDDSAVQQTLTNLAGKIEELEKGTYDDTEIRGLITGIQNDLTDLGNTVSGMKIPTKTSELMNDSGFLTTLPEEYVTDTELEEKGYAKSVSVYSKAETYSKSEVYSKEEVDAKMSAGVHYKGSCNTYADLPANAEIGDMYNVKAADTSHGVKAGDNAVWNGTEWDVLSGTVDLSGCVSVTDVITNEEIDAIWNS